jgi:hypothetical protein
MKNQLLLFESDQFQTPILAVLEQLPLEQREVATQLLAELMARSLAGCVSGRGEADTEEGTDE